MSQGRTDRPVQGLKRDGYTGPQEIVQYRRQIRRAALLGPRFEVVLNLWGPVCRLNENVTVVIGVLNTIIGWCLCSWLVYWNPLAQSPAPSSTWPESGVTARSSPP